MGEHMRQPTSRSSSTRSRDRRSNPILTDVSERGESGSTAGSYERMQVASDPQAGDYGREAARLDVRRDRLRIAGLPETAIKAAIALDDALRRGGLESEVVEAIAREVYARKASSREAAQNRQIALLGKRIAELERRGRWDASRS